MSNSDLAILQKINRLPFELMDIIKSYLPISILKKCRKIKLYELPVKYRIFKDISDHFHFKKMSNDIDHNAMKQHLKVLQIQYCQKHNIYNSIISVSSWFKDIKECVHITSQIQTIERAIDNYILLERILNEEYYTSIIHLNNFKIILDLESE
jgi:hypothetical protein